MAPLLDERPMQKLGATVREPTSVETDAIEEIRTMAIEFTAGRLPVEEVRRCSSGERRWLATRFTPREHPAFRSLMALLDALIASDPTTSRTYPTKHGLLTQDDIRILEGAVVREEGQEVVLLPVRYPWSTRPDSERGSAGIRAPAVFRPKDERKPVYDTFRTVPEPQAREKEWWE